MKKLIIIMLLCLVLLTACGGSGDKLIGRYTRTETAILGGVTVTTIYHIAVYQHCDVVDGEKSCYQYEVQE